MKIIQGVLLATTAIGICAFAGPASAQDASGTDPDQNGRATKSTQQRAYDAEGEIIVTARRHNERAQDVPVAVTVATPEMLRNQNITQVSDLQRIAPSLTVTNSMRGAGYPAYSIRGQRSVYTPNPLTDPPIGLYFADVTLGTGIASNNSLFDLASVQVLRGPQGTLFGRNTTGGAVLFSPAPPTDDFEGYVQLSGGDYGYVDGEAVLNMPLGENAAIRVGGKITRRNGYTHNELTGQDTDNRDGDGARVSLRLSPTTNFESTFIGTYARDSSTHAYRLDQISRAGYISSLTGSAGPTLGRQLGNAGADMAFAELALTQGLDGYSYRSPRNAENYGRNLSIQNNSTLKLGTITLRNIIAYRDATARVRQDWDGSAVEIFAYDGGSTRSKIFTEEFQVLADVGKAKFVAGAYYYHSSDHDISQTNIYGQFAAMVPQVFPILSYTDYDSTSQSVALFGHAEVDLSSILPGLSLAGGFRYTWDSRSVDWFNLSGRGTPPAFTCQISGVPVSNTSRQQICGASEDVSFDRPTWDVNLSYHVTPDVMVYAAHRHGYRSGGFNAQRQPGGGVSSFGPESVNDIEIGLKSEFRAGGIRGRFNVSGYEAWYDDIQRAVGRVLPNGEISNRTENAASATIKGIEAELALQLSDRLTLNAGYSYIDAGYGKWIDQYPAGNIAGQPALSVDISDSRFAFVPKHQFNASLSYDLPISHSAGKLTIIGSVSGISNFQTQEINTSNCGPDGAYGPCLLHAGQLPGYTTGNIRLDWRNFMGRGFDVAAFVTNVTDKYYKTDAIGALHLGYQSVGIGAPRMFGGEIRIPFGAEAY